MPALLLQRHKSTLSNSPVRKTTLGRLHETEARTAIEFMMGAEGASFDAIDQTMIAVSLRANRPTFVTVRFVCVDTTTTLSIRCMDV